MTSRVIESQTKKTKVNLSNLHSVTAFKIRKVKTHSPKKMTVILVWPIKIKRNKLTLKNKLIAKISK